MKLHQSTDTTPSTKPLPLLLTDLRTASVLNGAAAVGILETL